MSDAEDFFGGGSPAMSWSDKSVMNVWRGGEIVAEPKKVQQRDFITKEPKFWTTGDKGPMWALVVTLQTQERVPNDPQDTGLRRLFIQSGLRTAVQDALQKAQSGMTVGGKLWVMWTGEKPSSVGGSPAKIYQAHYEAGVSGGQAQEFFQAPEPAAPAEVYHNYAQQTAAPQPWAQQDPPNGVPQGSPAPAPWAQPAPQPVAAQAPAPWTQGPPSNGSPQSAVAQAPPWQQPQPSGPPAEAPPPWAQQPSAQAPWQQQGPPNGAPAYTGPPAGDPSNPFGPPQQYAQQNPYPQQG
jgi:hypothetical protein